MAEPAVGAVLDAESYRQVQRGIRELDREAQKQLNAHLRAEARAVASTAKSNASWSSRIPGSIGVSVTARRVAVKARSAKAPHARPFEGRSRGTLPRASFRHPVFGDREKWVEQSTRPFLQPAVQQHEQSFFSGAVAAIDDAASGLGWR